jgi:hypothetical protein
MFHWGEVLTFDADGGVKFGDHVDAPQEPALNGWRSL